MSTLPKKPSGNDPEAVFHQSVHDKVHGPAGKIRSSSTVRVSHTTKGIFLHAKTRKKPQVDQQTPRFRGSWDPVNQVQTMRGDMFVTYALNESGLDGPYHFWIWWSDDQPTQAPDEYWRDNRTTGNPVPDGWIPLSRIPLALFPDDPDGLAFSGEVEIGDKILTFREGLLYYVNDVPP